MKKIILAHGKPAGRSVSLMLLGLAVLLGCSGQPPIPRPSAAPGSAMTSGVRVLLLWSEPVDLDLYVTEPSLETVYFANPVSRTGGKLERDVTCGTVEGGTKGETLVEEVRWDGSSLGRYRVGVDFADACGGDTEETAFRVVTEAWGERRESSGTVRRERFQPSAVEFDVPAK